MIGVFFLVAGIALVNGDDKIAGVYLVFAALALFAKAALR
jgi:hypothetical protein